jgi:hypothetical protein
MFIYGVIIHMHGILRGTNPLLASVDKIFAKQHTVSRVSVYNYETFNIEVRSNKQKHTLHIDEQSLWSVIGLSILLKHLMSDGKGRI